MTDEIKIEEGIPVPNYNTPKFPFAAMKVGDSFAIPQDSSIATMRSNAMKAAKKLKMKFRVSALHRRVWRVE